MGVVADQRAKSGACAATMSRTRRSVGGPSESYSSAKT